MPVQTPAPSPPQTPIPAQITAHPPNPPKSQFRQCQSRHPPPPHPKLPSPRKSQPIHQIPPNHSSDNASPDTRPLPTPNSRPHTNHSPSTKSPQITVQTMPVQTPAPSPPQTPIHAQITAHPPDLPNPQKSQFRQCPKISRFLTTTSASATIFNGFTVSCLSFTLTRHSHPPGRSERRTCLHTHLKLLAFNTGPYRDCLRTQLRSHTFLAFRPAWQKPCHRRPNGTFSPLQPSRSKRRHPCRSHLVKTNRSRKALSPLLL